MHVAFDVVAPRPQAEIQSPPFHQWTLPDGSQWTGFYRTTTDYLLRFPDLADFQVSRDGRSVCCWPVDAVSDESVQHLYLNQVLPLALSKQDKLVFHASAVEINGEAVAFMGESGRGKSTLAASFATNGFRFLTDDGLVLQARGDTFDLLPSHASIRLWEDSEEALIDASAEKALPVEFTTKSRFLAGDSIEFCDQARRLRCVYFLGSGDVDEISFAAVPGKEALIEMIKHSFLLDIEERELLSRQFEELSRLVPQVSFYQLDYPRCYENLGVLRQKIQSHLAAV